MPSITFHPICHLILLNQFILCRFLCKLCKISWSPHLRTEPLRPLSLGSIFQGCSSQPALVAISSITGLLEHCNSRFTSNLDSPSSPRVKITFQSYFKLFLVTRQSLRKRSLLFFTSNFSLNASFQVMLKAFRRIC